MKLTNERASMTRALVYYARLKGSSVERSRLELYSTIYGAFKGNPSLSAELCAIQECLLVLRVTGRSEELRAIEEIYLKPFARSPHRPISKNEISMRVLRFATENAMDERTVYRRLKTARELWMNILKNQSI